MSKLEDLLTSVKKLNRKTETLIQASKILYGGQNNGFLPKESLTSFPIQEGNLDWSKSHELGQNVLGIRVPSDNSIRFILRAVSTGIYTNHYHDCHEKVEVLNEQGELIFNINNKEIIINYDNPIINIKEGVLHSVLVKAGSFFQVDFK